MKEIRKYLHLIGTIKARNSHMLWMELTADFHGDPFVRGVYRVDILNGQATFLRVDRETNYGWSFGGGGNYPHYSLRLQMQWLLSGGSFENYEGNEPL